MKKIYLVGAMCAYLFAGCAGNASQAGHDEHNHELEAHDHEHEGEDHDHDHEGHEHEGHDHEHEEEHEAGGTHPGEIVFKKALAEAVGLQTVTVNPAPFTDVIKTSGRVMAAQGEESVIVATVPGVISFGSLPFVDGTAVRKGQAVLSIVSVVSPLNGYLKNIQVKEGDYVSVGQPLATISQNNRLVLRADVSERYYNDLPMIQTANFMTPYDNALYKLSDLRGRLLSYGKASDMNSFYVPVTFEFDNKGAVIPGSFVEIFLLTEPMENVLSVPVSALIEEQGVYSVFIRLDEEGYKKQWVTLGANNGSEVQILSGLKPGDEVVTRGAYQIKLSSASNAIPAHSHSH